MYMLYLLIDCWRCNVLFVKLHADIVHLVHYKIVLEMLLFFSMEIQFLVKVLYISSVKSLAFVLALTKE